VYWVTVTLLLLELARIQISVVPGVESGVLSILNDSSVAASHASPVSPGSGKLSCWWRVRLRTDVGGCSAIAAAMALLLSEPQPRIASSRRSEVSRRRKTTPFPLAVSSNIRRCCWWNRSRHNPPRPSARCPVPSLTSFMPNLSATPPQDLLALRSLRTAQGTPQPSRPPTARQPAWSGRGPVSAYPSGYNSSRPVRNCGCDEQS